MLVVAVTDKWRKTFPGATMGLLELTGADNTRPSAALEVRKRETLAHLRERYAGFTRKDFLDLPVMSAYDRYYRRFKKTRTERRAERVEALAARLQLPRAALDGGTMTLPEGAEHSMAPHAQPFRDPDPFQELRYPNAIAAKKAVARTLGIPLARLPADQIAALDALLSETLDKPAIEDFVRTHLKKQKGD